MEGDKTALAQGRRPKSAGKNSTTGGGKQKKKKGPKPLCEFAGLTGSDQAALWVISNWAGMGAGKPASARDSRMARLPSKYTCQ